MTQRTWLILGATSIIAERFAHCAARCGHRLLLAGRQAEQLNLIGSDIRIRYKTACDVLLIDLAEQVDPALSFIQSETTELDVFIAHSEITDNLHLTDETITQLIKVNILTTTLIINRYLSRQQKEYNLLFLSSVAACRGRAKNSLYGASKASIEIYLQGLQQQASSNQNLCIARLGFIDTRQTYGLSGIVYAAPPDSCARACWNALKHKKRAFYYPFFWRAIMAIMTHLPFFLYKRMSKI